MEWVIVAAILFHALKPQLMERRHYAKKRVLREIKRRWDRGNPH